MIRFMVMSGRGFSWMTVSLSDAVYMTRGGGGGAGPTYFWGAENLHPWYFLGSRDLSLIFLGLKVFLI